MSERGNPGRPRGHSDRTYRRAVLYGGAAVLAAVLAFAVIYAWAGDRVFCDAAGTECETTAAVTLVFVPAVPLTVGGIGAFVLAYRAWHRGEGWMVWQGAGWFLFVTMVMYLSIAGTSAIR